MTRTLLRCNQLKSWFHGGENRLRTFRAGSLRLSPSLPDDSERICLALTVALSRISFLPDDCIIR